jgi:thioester reductase-like protein
MQVCDKPNDLSADLQHITPLNTLFSPNINGTKELLAMALSSPHPEVAQQLSS